MPEVIPRNTFTDPAPVMDAIWDRLRGNDDWRRTHALVLRHRTGVRITGDRCESGSILHVKVHRPGIGLPMLLNLNELSVHQRDEIVHTVLEFSAALIAVTGAGR